MFARNTFDFTLFGSTLCSPCGIIVADEAAPECPALR